MKAWIALIMLIIVTMAFAQPPETLWTRTYGWEFISYCDAYAVQRAWGGGFIVAGSVSNGALDADFYIVRIDDSGDTLWTRRYGWEVDDECHDLQRTTDGGYILAGVCNQNFYSIPHFSDYCLMKMDSAGDTLWSRSYTKYEVNEANAVQQTSDGGYILVGSACYPNVCSWFIVKTDSVGDTLWTRIFGNTSYHVAYSVQQTTDGGYIIAGVGNTNGAEPSNIYLMKLTESGDLQWERMYGESSYDYGYSVQQTTDGGYIVTGRIKYYLAGHDDMFLLKTDSAGDSLWMRIFGGLDHDAGNSVKQTQDGGYIIAGYTESFGEEQDDYYIVRTDSVGDTLWTNTYGGLDLDQANSISITNDGGYIAAGFSFSFGGNMMYLVRLGTDIPNAVPEESVHMTPMTAALYPNYPNPFNSNTILTFDISSPAWTTLAVYNLQGQKVAELLSTFCQPGRYTRPFEAGNLASGIYFARLQIAGADQIQKMMFIK